MKNLYLAILFIVTLFISSNSAFCENRSQQYEVYSLHQAISSGIIKVKVQGAYGLNSPSQLNGTNNVGLRDRINRMLNLRNKSRQRLEQLERSYDVAEGRDADSELLDEIQNKIDIEQNKYDSLDILIEDAQDDTDEEELDMYESSHYGKCMMITITNTSSKFLRLRIDCATTLIPYDDAIQTMIVTKQEIINILSYGSRTIRVYAMCGQVHDHAPKYPDLFNVGAIAAPAVAKIAHYIQDNGLQDISGQCALWAVTDNADLSTLKKFPNIIINDSIVAETKKILTVNAVQSKLLTEDTSTTSPNVDENRYTMYYTIGITIIIVIITVIVLVRRRSLVRNEDVT